jgi:hypothetical protein
MPLLLRMKLITSKANMTTVKTNNSFKNLYFAHIQYLLALRYLYSIASAKYGLCHVRSIQLIIRYVSSTLKFRPKKSNSINLFTPNPFFGCLGYL